jgi:hypothetical protein
MRRDRCGQLADDFPGDRQGVHDRSRSAWWRAGEDRHLAGQVVVCGLLGDGRGRSRLLGLVGGTGQLLRSQSGAEERI